MSALSDRLKGWAYVAGDMIIDYESESIEQISDRLEEGSEPLLAIADLAAGDYPSQARAAALALAGQGDDGSTISNMLLIALVGVFGDQEKMWSRDIVDALKRDESLPFGSWNDGAGINPAELARLLRPYRVKPRTVRRGDKTAMGYVREQFEPVWERYGADLSNTPNTSLTPQAISGCDEPTQDPACVGSEDAEKAREIRDVLDVLGKEGGIPPEPDLEPEPGDPKGETRVWTSERMVFPRKGRYGSSLSKNRIRETTEIAFCEDGWFNPESRPLRDAVCSTFPAGHVVGEPQIWTDRDRWRTFHNDHPVQWRVVVKAKSGRPRRHGGTHYFCDAELPDEYRPTGDPDGEGD